MKNFKGIKIAVVDDDPDIVKILNHIINEELPGASIINGKTGIDACYFAKREKPDAMILDIKMPKMSGLEAIKNIRSMADKYYQDLPVVILTSSQNENDKAQVLSDISTLYTSKYYHDLKDVMYYLKMLLETRKSA